MDGCIPASPAASDFRVRCLSTNFVSLTPGQFSRQETGRLLPDLLHIAINQAV